jgi:hypothetical protein
VKWTEEEHKYAHLIFFPTNVFHRVGSISSQIGHRLSFHLYSSNSIANKGKWVQPLSGGP